MLKIGNMSIKKYWRLVDWNRDIALYYRLKSLYDATRSDLVKDKMEKIKNKWPNHQKAFE